MGATGRGMVIDGVARALANERVALTKTIADLTRERDVAIAEAERLHARAEQAEAFQAERDELRAVIRRILDSMGSMGRDDIDSVLRTALENAQ